MSKSTVGSTNAIFGILAIIAGIGLFGESSLAILNHIKREQYRRLIVDFYCFLSSVLIMNMEIGALPTSKGMKQFLSSEFKFLTCNKGLAVFYVFAGSFELTRVSNASSSSLYLSLVSLFFFILTKVLFLSCFYIYIIGPYCCRWRFGKHVSLLSVCTCRIDLCLRFDRRRF